MRNEKSLKHDKGVAGLSVLLSLVVMLFIIGLLVMIFALMGVELQDASYISTTGTLTNTTTVGAVSSVTGRYPTGTSGLRSCVLTITDVAKINSTGYFSIASGNYTNVACLINATTSVTAEYNLTAWNVTGTYTHNADSGASDVINDTVQGISSAIDWFDIFVVLGAMVVLILLTVIIIVAIRGSGLMVGDSGGTSGSSRNIGSA